MTRKNEEAKDQQLDRLADRREFLRLGAKVAAVMAALGASGTAAAQFARQAPKSDQVQWFINKGIDAGSKRAMLDEAKKAQLPEEQMKVLDKLTDADLRALKVIKAKIPSPEEVLEGDTTGGLVF